MAGNVLAKRLRESPELNCEVSEDIPLASSLTKRAAFSRRCLEVVRDVLIVVLCSPPFDRYDAMQR